MKRIQLSAAQKRKLAKKKQEKTLNLDAKNAKLTSFFTQVSQYDTRFQVKASLCHQKWIQMQ